MYNENDLLTSRHKITLDGFECNQSNSFLIAVNEWFPNLFYCKILMQFLKKLWNS